MTIIYCWEGTNGCIIYSSIGHFVSSKTSLFVKLNDTIYDASQEGYQYNQYTFLVNYHPCLDYQTLSNKQGRISNVSHKFSVNAKLVLLYTKFLIE